MDKIFSYLSLKKKSMRNFLAYIYIYLHKYYLHGLNVRQQYSAIWSNMSCSCTLITSRYLETRNLQQKILSVCINGILFSLVSVASLPKMKCFLPYSIKKFCSLATGINTGMYQPAAEKLLLHTNQGWSNCNPYVKYIGQIF